MRLVHAAEAPAGCPHLLREARGRAWLDEAWRTVEGTVPAEVGPVPALVVLGSTRRLLHHAVVPTNPEG